MYFTRQLFVYGNLVAPRGEIELMCAMMLVISVLMAIAMPILMSQRDVEYQKAGMCLGLMSLFGFGTLLYSTF
jgi:hypothetical protein